MKHNLEIGLVDLSTKWHFLRTLAYLELTDEANAVSWLMSPYDFTPSRDNQGFMRYEYPGSSSDGLPDLVLYHANTDVCVLVGFDLEEAREGDKSGIFGTRAQGKFKLNGSDKPYAWAWVNSKK
jgi:hypothetical protein